MLLTIRMRNQSQKRTSGISRVTVRKDLHLGLCIQGKALLLSGFPSALVNVIVQWYSLVSTA
jgi:hypothetical protein